MAKMKGGEVIAEYLVKQNLAVMRFPPVDMKVERAVRRQQPSGFLKFWADKSEIVVVGVQIAKFRQLG